ncbi:uncharacterized protein PG986_001016 [Apiospora aurea]|uniref:Rhodanese domain-containing protein n=1 Tax=Apiospora aurea TaxID=335848 RepID=A0ABR1QVQ3_9PEZI
MASCYNHAYELQRRYNSIGPKTESLRSALLILGYDAVFHGYEGMTRVPMTHQAWVKLMRRKFDDTSSPDHTIARADFEAIIGDCEAVTDMPCVNFARKLVEAFSEAKVIERYRGGFHNWGEVLVLRRTLLASAQRRI